MSLENMLRITEHNFPDAIFAHANEALNSSIAQPAFTQPDYVCRNLRCNRAIHPLSIAASLRRHVGSVIFLCSKKQVGGIYAGRVIAAVQNAKTIRDRAVVDFPRNAMGHRVIAKSVPVAVSGRCPLPTRSVWALAYGLINSGPKAFSDRYRLTARARVVRAASTAKPRITSPSANTKEPFAVLAYQLSVFCFNMISGHGVTSETGCKVSRLGRVLQHSFGPSVF